MNEKRLTPELKAKLKNVLGFSIEAPFEYVPKAFREKDESGVYVISKEFWPVFILKSKDGVESAEVEDEAGFWEVDKNGGSSRLHMQTGKHRIESLERGLIGVKNFLFEDGRVLRWDVKTKEQTITSEAGTESKKNNVDVYDIIRFLRADLQVELVNAINERSILTDEEKQGL
jgi:hypothetical protein